MEIIGNRLYNLVRRLWNGPDVTPPDDYHAQISAWNWKVLVQDAKENACESIEDGMVGEYYLGSVLQLTPSGKFYMPFAYSNVDACPACKGSGYNRGLRSLVRGLRNAAEYAFSRPYYTAMRGTLHTCNWRNLFHWQSCETCAGLGSMEAYHDELWREVLDDIAGEHGGYITSGEGDPLDVFFTIQL